MKKRFVKVLSLLLCVLIAVGTVTISKRPEAEAATNEYTTTLTSVSEAPEGQEQTNILHMDRTVTESASGGFDVTLTSYIDDMMSSAAPMNIVFVMDQSTSMSETRKEEVVSAVKTVLQELKLDGGEHRVGFVAFGGLSLDGILSTTSDKLISLDDALNYNFNKYINVAGGATYTHNAMEKAQSLLSGANDGKHTQACILMTDGVPGILAFNTSMANSALKTSSEMKKSGVLIYALKLDYELLSNDAKKDGEIFCKKITGYYNSDATDMGSGTVDDRYQPDDWVFSIEETGSLAENVQQAIINTKLYPFTLNSSAITQDVVTPYFTISNTSCTIQKANYNNNNEITSWSNNGSLSVHVDGQRVYVTGFDYTGRAVSPYNDNSARLVIKYHINPASNFFGGNGVPTATPGTTLIKAYSIGGSGIYCNGNFLKPFNNIAVNVALREPTVSTGEDEWLDCNYEVDWDEYYTVPDLEKNNYNHLFDGIMNKFVKVTVTTSLNSSNKTIFKATGPVVDIESVYGKAYDSYKITSESGDRFIVSYIIEPTNSFNKSNSVGRDANELTVRRIRTLKAIWKYEAWFEFEEPVLAEGVSAPDPIYCGTSIDGGEANATSYDGYMEGDTDETEMYLFTGFWLNYISRNNDKGTVEYKYSGVWSDNPEHDTTVCVFLQSKTPPFDGDEIEYDLIRKLKVPMKLENITISEIAKCDGEDYQFIDSCYNDYIENVFTEYFPESDGWISYYNDSGLFQYVLNDTNETKLMALASVYLCPSCGQMIPFGDLDGGNVFCYNESCDDCGVSKPLNEMLHYADYEFGCIRKYDYGEIDIYFNRVNHTFSATVNYDDNPDAQKTYSYSGLPAGCEWRDANGGNIVVYNKHKNYREGVKEIRYTEDGRCTECTPFYSVSYAEFPVLYDHNDYCIEDWLWLDDFFYYPNFIYRHIPAYDINVTVNLTRMKYDLTVTKQWSTSVSQKDMQSCIFGLYELDEAGDYNLLTRFVIGVDEFEYKNEIWTASKTIEGLVAGKDYVLEEESWSYKTESDWCRGADNEITVFSPSDEPVEKICTNYNSNNWNQETTVEKGIRNRLSSDDKSSIVATQIKKNVKAGVK